MKIAIPFVIAFVLSFQTVRSQDVIDKIAEKTCSCIKELDSTATLKQMEAQLGICMIQAATPYQKELKKQQNIDISKLDDKTGEQLGQVLGTRMLSKCPTEMLRLGTAANDAKGDADVSSGQTMTGTITDMQSGQFYTIFVKDNKGRDQKLLWMSYFKGSEMLKNGLSEVKGKSFEIGYTENEFYNPVLKDYMKYKVIIDLTKK